MISRLGLYCLLGGLCTTVFTSAHEFAISWFAGAVLAASFAPIAQWGPRRPLGQFAVVLLVTLIVGLVCSLSEAFLFLPETKPHLLHDLVNGGWSYVVLAAVLAVLAKTLRLTDPSVQKVIGRPTRVVPWLVLLSGLFYLIYFLVFGAITFEFFTKKYYAHPPQPGAWIFAFEAARGALMTLAVLPLIYTLRMRRWKAALTVGVVLWIAGGGASLLMPNPFMVTAQRYIHIVEILTQNLSLGITAVLLLRKKDQAETPAAGSTQFEESKQLPLLPQMP